MESRFTPRFSSPFLLRNAAPNVGVIFNPYEIREAHLKMGQRMFGISQRGAQLSQEQAVKAPAFGRVVPNLPQNATIQPPKFSTRPGGLRSVNDVGLLDAANIALRLEKVSQTPPEKRTKEQNYEIAILQRDLRQNITFVQGQVTKEEWELAKKTMAAPIPPSPVTGKRSLI